MTTGMPPGLHDQQIEDHALVETGRTHSCRRPAPVVKGTPFGRGRRRQGGRGGAVVVWVSAAQARLPASDDGADTEHSKPAPSSSLFVGDLKGGDTFVGATISRGGGLARPGGD